MSSFSGPFTLFSLIPSVEPEGDQVLPKFGKTIHSATSSGKDLYLGLGDGNLLHYTCDKGQVQLQTRRNVDGGRKLVEGLIYLPDDMILIALADSMVSLHDSRSLETVLAPGNNVQRGVSSIALIPNHAQFLIGRRRSIHVMECTGRIGHGLNLRQVMEIPLSADGPPVAMACTKSHVCFADYVSYKIADLNTGKIINLLPFDSKRPQSGKPIVGKKPVVCAVEEDFLCIMQPEGQKSCVGFFVNGQGEPKRGSLEFPSHPTSFVYQDPYVLALIGSTIHMYNIMTLTPVQQLTMEGGEMDQFLTVTRSSIFGDALTILYARLNALYALKKHSLEEQVRHYLKEGKAENALKLLRQSSKMDQIYSPMQMLQEHQSWKMVAIHALQTGNFALFSQILLDEKLSLSEILPIYADLWKHLHALGNAADALIPTPLTTFLETTLQHQDVDEASKASIVSALYDDAKLALIPWLQRLEKQGVDARLVQTTLALIHSQDPNYFLSLPSEADFDVLQGALIDLNAHLALANLYEVRGDDKHLLQTLANMDNDAGLPRMVQHLAMMRNKLASLPPHQTEELNDLFWKYTNHVLSKDPSLSAEILLPNPQDVAQTLSRVKTTVQQRQRQASIAAAALLPSDTEFVLEKLKKHGQDSIVPFLERLVAAGSDVDSKHHTMLAESFIAQIANHGETCDTQESTFTREQRPGHRKSFAHFLSNRGDGVAKARLKLLNFLQQSTLYDANQVLKSLDSIGKLTPEKAVLYGRLGQHDQALDLLVHKLEDLIGAEAYCGTFTTNDENLFLVLLKLYLGSTQRDALFSDIVHVLNNPKNQLLLSQVLDLIPEYWALDLIGDFLSRSLSTNLYQHRQAQIEKGLWTAENLKVNGKLVEDFINNPPALLTDRTTCSICGGPILENVFARLPNKSLAHVHCK